jgi:AAA family ATP:ADP antiporter
MSQLIRGDFRMVPGFIRNLFGDMSANEAKKFSLCSITFMFLIGAYWELRVLKDALFDDLVGMVHQPKAKMLSLLVIIPLILIYTKLVDTVERHKLFYFICTTYGVLFALIAYFYVNPMPNFAPALVANVPGKLLGWITYITVESFGSLSIGLFWAFMASTTNTASAKRGYALIYGVGQIGSIGGPTLVTYAPVLGLPMLLMIGATAVLAVPFLIFMLMSIIPQEDMQSDVHAQAAPKKRTGLLEGLRLLTTTPYLLGVLVISTVYEIVGTIMDLQMKLLAREVYTTKETFAAFLGSFGQTTNGFALLLAFFGTGIFVRKFGVRFCLVMYPVLSGVVVASTLIYPTLWPVFFAVLMIKGLSYTLNNPVKELMYIPTSKDVKFKAKSWIEAFGGRTAKAGGSIINNFFAGDLTALMTYGTFASLGVIGVWACIAFLIGTTYNTLIKENKIIE